MWFVEWWFINDDAWITIGSIHDQALPDGSAGGGAARRKAGSVGLVELRYDAAGRPIPGGRSGQSSAPADGWRVRGHLEREDVQHGGGVRQAQRATATRTAGSGIALTSTSTGMWRSDSVRTSVLRIQVPPVSLASAPSIAVRSLRQTGHMSLTAREQIRFCRPPIGRAVVQSRERHGHTALGHHRPQPEPGGLRVRRPRRRPLRHITLIDPSNS